MYCAPLAPALAVPDVPVAPVVPVAVPLALPVAGLRHPWTVIVLPLMLGDWEVGGLDGLVDCALRATPAMASAPQAAKMVRSIVLCLLPDDVECARRHPT
jgi:hypothetical protein